MSDLRLLVAGQAYGGWKTVAVRRAVDEISGQFTLTATDRWDSEKAAWALREEDACEIQIDGQTVITGSIDERSVELGDSSHEVTLSGRDASALLVDCQIVLSSWELAGPPPALACLQKLAEPFGVPISLGAGVTLPPLPNQFSITPGDTPFELIDRACRMSGTLAMPDGAGGVVLARVGQRKCPTALVEGDNVLTGASARYSAQGRFARYVAHGQRTGSDTVNGVACSSKAEATDPGVKRSSRVMLIHAEGNVDRAGAQRRADWERSTRAARGTQLSIAVLGWAHKGGLWTPGELVDLDCPTLGVVGEMMIVSTDMVLDESGEVCTLTVGRPDAYLPEPADENGWKR